MYSITRNTMRRQYEYSRNQDGRILDSRPILSAHLAYMLAYKIAGQNPHVSPHVWKAAGLVEANAVNIYPAGQRPGHWQYDHYRTDRATVKSETDPGKDYTIFTMQYQAEEPSAPLPRLEYGCTCDHWQKGIGRRPLIEGRPLCKHILAFVIAGRIETDREALEAEAARLTLLAGVYTPAARPAIEKVQPGQVVDSFQKVQADDLQTQEWRRSQAAADRRAALNRLDEETRRNPAKQAQIRERFSRQAEGERLPF